MKESNYKLTGWNAMTLDASWWTSEYQVELESRKSAVNKDVVTSAAVVVAIATYKSYMTAALATQRLLHTATEHRTELSSQRDRIQGRQSESVVGLSNDRSIAHQVRRSAAQRRPLEQRNCHKICTINWARKPCWDPPIPRYNERSWLIANSCHN